jgi:hypothetical protein
MSIIPSNVLSAAQLVNGVVATVNTARDIIKDSSNHELKGVINELYDGVIDLKGRLLDQDDEIRHLRGEITRRDEIVGPEGPHGYFFRKDDMTKPLCPKCAQQPESRNAVCMGPALKCNSGLLRTCPVCKFEVWEVAPKYDAAIAIASGPSTRSLLRGYV